MLRRIGLIFLLCFQCFAARAEPLTIFAAASLQGPLDKVLASYIQTHATAPPIVSYAGSSTLARQIELGAAPDIFISANAAWADYVATATDAASPMVLLQNQLVVVGAPDDDPLSLTAAETTERLNGGRLAVALVDAVPAGIYAKEALVNLELWEPLAPHLAQTDNVRTALAYVARGAAPLGIVYVTDARAEPRVQIVAKIGPETHSPITYPMVVLNTEADELARFLSGDEAAKIFARHGFTLPAN